MSWRQLLPAAGGLLGSVAEGLALASCAKQGAAVKIKHPNKNSSALATGRTNSGQLSHRFLMRYPPEPSANSRR